MQQLPLGLRRGLQHRGIWRSPNDQTGSSFISAVSSIANMLVGVLFDYDNDDLGTLSPTIRTASTKGLVFINGYLGAAGYASPARIISTSTMSCPRRCRCSSRSPDDLRRWTSRSTIPTPACRASTGASPTTVSRRRVAELHPERPALRRRSRLHQPDPLADPQLAKPGASDRAWPDGHLQLGRVAPICTWRTA